MAFTTRSSLLHLITNGDEISWEEFYRIYKPLILLRGSHLRLNFSECEELVQQVMLSFFKSSKSFCYDRTKGKFRSYFIQIINNKACDIMRKRDDCLVSIENVQEKVNALSCETQDVWENEWNEHILNQAFEILRKRCNPTTLQSYEYFVFEKLPAKKVAKLLDIETNVVYQHKARVEKMLKQIIQEIEK